MCLTYTLSCVKSVLLTRSPCFSEVVGRALNGLRKLGDTAEVRELIAALTPQVQECTGWNSWSLANAFNGLLVNLRSGSFATECHGVVQSSPMGLEIDDPTSGSL